MTKTLKDFLNKHYACEDGYQFAKDLTLEQFLTNCKRSDWILWLFCKVNPDKKKELFVVKFLIAISLGKNFDIAFNPKGTADYQSSIVFQHEFDTRLLEICRKYLPLKIWNYNNL